MLKKFINLFRQNIFTIALAAGLVFTFPALCLAQINENSQGSDNQQTIAKNKTEASQANEQNINSQAIVPVLKDYKEIVIGMPAEGVRDKLGKAELDDRNTLFYRFSEDETAQIILDDSKNVRIISAMYLDKKGTAPKPADIFGDGVEITPNEEGALYKVVRYPDAGYVVMYSRSSGDNPMVIVTMQRM